MKLLLLNGHGISLNVDGARLHIKDGKYSDDIPQEEFVYSPRRIDVDHIVVYGRTGNISFDAIRWLMKHNVQVSILNWDGTLLTTMLPNNSVQIDAKFAQYNAYSDNNLRVTLAKNLIKAKFSRTQSVLNYLKHKYVIVNNDFSKEEQRLEKANSIQEIMMVEGRVASFYWQELTKIIPEKYEFETREYQARPRGAGDVINCMLNYGYTILEAECLKAINTTGLDAHIGFMHEKCNGKNSLAYYMQEPFRFLIDLAVINAIENNLMDKSDFIRTESYTLRLRPTGAKKLIEEIDKQLLKKTTYNNKQWSWRYIITEKATELSHFLQGKKKQINFSTPEATINRTDSEEIRKKILAISYAEWERKGYSRGTLHYMKTNAKKNETFKLNKHTKKIILNT